MTAPITGARTGGVSFRIAGIPVTIHASFLLVIALLGFGLGGIDRIATWAAVATVAVLLHELGHGLVGRLAGLAPRIDLAGFGGVTSWSGRGRGELGRGWSLAISLAGPGIGFVGGFVALLLGAPCCTVPATADLGTFAAGVWLFASFGWGILNLLPILPLDGGQALRELLPGTPAQRLRRAAIVGVVAGAALVVFALVSEAVFLALVAGWITWSNVQQVQAVGDTGPEGPSALVARVQEAARAGDHATVVALSRRLVDGDADTRVRQFAAVALVQALVASGGDAEAYRLVTDPRRDVALPTELVGAVVARHPDRVAVAGAAQRWATAADRDTRGVGLVVLAAHGRHDEVRRLVESLPVTDDGPLVDAGVAVAVQVAAHRAGAFADAAAIGARLIAAGGLHSPVLAYDTACSLARAGRRDDAVEALRTALRMGFADHDLIARDEDLVALHDHPAWPELRAGRA